MINILKKIIKLIPYDFTQNQKYDSQTKKIIRKVCKPDSNCIDVGCHKGEVLDLMLQSAPNGHHFGFEPIPEMYKRLKEKYNGANTTILDIAMSNEKKQTTFNYVISNPAYSGLIKRKYDKSNEVDEQITVETDLLDNILPVDTKIDLIKIDVEGAELLVLEGAINTIKRNKPVIIFEHGLGASEFYDATPSKVYNLLSDCKLKVSTLKNWLSNKKELSLKEFEKQFYEKINYYFIAYPQT